jgi:hypothetical protein
MHRRQLLIALYLYTVLHFFKAFSLKRIQYKKTHGIFYLINGDKFVVTDKLENNVLKMFLVGPDQIYFSF